MLAEAQEYREKLIEKVSEHDDKLLEKYLDGEEITEAEIKAALRNRVIKSVYDEETAFVVVICGSAFKNKGVQPHARRGGRLPAVAARRAGDHGHRSEREAGEGEERR